MCDYITGMLIAENIAKIEERIRKACVSTGREREEITLMGVSKFVPISMVDEAWRAGISFFGESRVKEGTEKFTVFRKEYSDLTDTCRLSVHLIGSLQRNKAKTAALFFDCIQSVDRLELIEELAKYVCAREKPLEVLLELHTGEETKSGFEDFDDLFRAVELILTVSGLKAAGLMTMAPYMDDMTQLSAISTVRSSFRQLVKAQEELNKRFPFIDREKGSWDCLSMGMSNDFEIAIEEGSTMLRIGSMIFKG